MLRYVYGNDLNQFPKFRDGMFRDRAEQFARRLNWDVTVDEVGEERDEYDAMNPLYVVWECGDGRHGGSLRLLPTIGRTMVNDHFAHLTQGVRIESPLIWECTRFCLAQGASTPGIGGIGSGRGRSDDAVSPGAFLGVFDPRMERIYRLLGVNPDVIGTSGEGVSNAFVLDTLGCVGPCGLGVSNAFVLDTRGNASHDWQLYR